MKTATKKQTITERGPSVTGDGEVQLLAIDSIVIDHRNDRDPEAIDKEEIRQLAHSIGLYGLQQPVGVVACEGGKYRLIFGHRRLEAVKSLGWVNVQARVMFGIDDDVVQQIRAVENLQRQDLNYVEEAFAVAGMVAAYEIDKPIADTPTESNKSVRDDAIKHVAARVGKSEQWVRDRAFLSRASAKVRAFCRDGSLPFPHAREIVKLTSQERQDEVAEMARAGRSRWKGGKPDPEEPPMPIDELRREVGRSLMSLAQVPWKRDVAFAGQPACNRCPRNSANQTGLFEYHAPDSGKGYKSTYKEPAAGVCTDRACFGVKSKAFSSGVRSAAGKFEKQPVPIKSVKAGKDGLNHITHGKISCTPTSVAPFVPEFATPNQVVAEIKDRAARAKERAEAAGKPKPARQSYTHRESPDDIARRKWREAVREWLKGIEKHVVKAASKDPVLGLAISLLDSSKEIDVFSDDASGFGRTKKAKPISAEAARAMVARYVPVKSLDQIQRGLAGLADNYLQIDASIEIIGDCEPIMQALCDELKIKMPARPVLADFMPKEDAKPSKPPKGKKSRGVTTKDLDRVDAEEVDDAD